MTPALRVRAPLFLLLLAAAIPATHAASCPEVIVRQAIVAGQDRVDAELLSFSAVIHDFSGTCTATILNSRYLLTAAHCAYTVGAAVHARTPERKGDPDAKVVNFISHPKYTRNSIIHDIAVVEVDPPLENVEYVTLHNGSPPKPESYARAAGYGVNKPETSNDGMGVFRRVDLPIVSMKRCLKALADANYRAPPQFTSKNYICAGYLGLDSCGGDTCSGDSGGPLCVKRDDDSKPYVQIGVTSAGATCGGEQVPGIYTSVAGHAHWIASTVTGDVQFANAFVTESKIEESSATSESPEPSPSPSPSLVSPTNSPVLPTVTPSVAPASPSPSSSPSVTPSISLPPSLPSPTTDGPVVSESPSRAVPTSQDPVLPTVSLSPSEPVPNSPAPSPVSTSNPVPSVQPSAAASPAASVSTTPVISISDVAEQRGKGSRQNSRTNEATAVPKQSAKASARPKSASLPSEDDPAANPTNARPTSAQKPNANPTDASPADAEDSPADPGEASDTSAKPTSDASASGDANKLRDVQNTRDTIKNARPNPSASGTTQTGDVNTTGETSSRDKSKVADAPPDTEGVTNGSVTGANAGSISAIVIAAVLGSLALVLGLFFGLRSVIRGREPALEFQETGFDDSLPAAVGAGAAAAANEDAGSAAAEADIPSSLESSLDTTPRQNPPPPPQPPASDMV